MLNQSGQTSEVRLLPNSFLQIDIYVHVDDVFATGCGGFVLNSSSTIYIV